MSNNKEILEKAIQKAIDGGWRGDLLDIKVVTQDDGLVRVYWDDTEWSVLDLIYNRAFAKALWGEEIVDVGLLTGSDWHQLLPKFEWHLSEMFIATDPIKYLGENI